jgi:hypothetical protein
VWDFWPAWFRTRARAGGFFLRESLSKVAASLDAQAPPFPVMNLRGSTPWDPITLLGLLHTLKILVFLAKSKIGVFACFFFAET